MQNQHTKIKTFLCNNNKIPEKEIMNRMPFTIVTKKIKCLERKLPKRVNGLYNGNQKTLVKEIEK